MKKLSALYMLASLFLVFSGFTPVQPEGKDPLPYWIDGVWQGKGYQLNTDTRWTISLSAHVESGTYTISYPSIPCGGEWELLESNAHQALFKETIKETFRCVNQGKIVITKIDQNYITFTLIINLYTIIGTVLNDVKGNCIISTSVMHYYPI